jgi:thiamine-monophosphate kinase
MEINENELLKKLARYGKKTAAHQGSESGLVRGIGDDGAVVALPEGQHVFVQDVLVEQVHFDLSIQRPFDVGKKAVYINVSDILAMGARPLYFLVTLGLPARIILRDVEELYRGMTQAAREFGLVLLGGDTTETREDFFIDVSMTGILKTSQYLGRDKATEGDLIGVTGLLGESAYGLHLLKDKGERYVNRFTRRFSTPKPPFRTWEILTDSCIPKAMMDISDGLVIDLERMMLESGKAAIIHVEQVPMPERLRKEGKELLALAGGEDYQLLFTFDRDRLPVVELLKRQKVQVSVIGEVRKGKGVRVYQGGEERKLPVKGYEHFGDVSRSASVGQPTNR